MDATRSPDRTFHHRLVAGRHLPLTVVGDSCMENKIFVACGEQSLCYSLPPSSHVHEIQSISEDLVRIHAKADRTKLSAILLYTVDAASGRKLYMPDMGCHVVRHNAVLLNPEVGKLASIAVGIRYSPFLMSNPTRGYELLITPPPRSTQADDFRRLEFVLVLLYIGCGLRLRTTATSFVAACSFSVKLGLIS